MIYGKTDGGTVDLSATGGATQGANQLYPTENTGVRIFGAEGLDEAGQATAWPGSVDGSGNASLVITAPDYRTLKTRTFSPPPAAHTSSSAETTAAIWTSRTSTSPAARPDIASTDPPPRTSRAQPRSGDVDGDGTPDILLGGNNAAWVVTGQNSTNDIYLNSTYTGYQITTPDSTYGPAQVAGVGDIDGDNAPDTLISFSAVNNGAGSSFLVYGRPTLTNVSLDPNQGFGADQGTRLNGPTGSATGTGADGIDGDMTPNAHAAIVIGQPGSNTVTATDAAVLEPVKVKIAKNAYETCQGPESWTYPYNGNSSHALPVCRLAGHKTLDQAVSTTSHGKPAPYNLTHSVWSNGNARLHGPFLSGSADANHTMVPVVDSFGTVFAYIRYVGKGCFAVYNSSGSEIGETIAGDWAGNQLPGTPTTTCSTVPEAGKTYVAGTMDVDLAGRACMKNSDLDGTLPNGNATWPASMSNPPTYLPEGWVHFQFQEASGSQLAFQGLEGFVPVADIYNVFQHNWPADAQHTVPRPYLDHLNQAYPTCGGRPSDYPGHITKANVTLSETFANPDEWFGTSTEQNFQMDRNQEIPAAGSNEDMFFNSTSATQTGDIVRGVVPKTTTSTDLDYMSYPDPNDFCWDPGLGGMWMTTRQPEQVTTWLFGELNANGDKNHRMIGWIPSRNPNAPECP